MLRELEERLPHMEDKLQELQESLGTLRNKELPQIVHTYDLKAKVRAEDSA